MGKDEVTVVLFPGSSGAPKKLRLPRRVVKLGIWVAFLVLIGFLGSTFYFTQQYLRLQGSETELAKLLRDSKIRKIQVEKFAQQVKNFETEMARLDDPNLATHVRDGSEPVTPIWPPMFEMDLNPSPQLAKDGRGGVEPCQRCKNTNVFACQRCERRGRTLPNAGKYFARDRKLPTAVGDAYRLDSM